MRLPNYIKNKKGFSLVELLVAMAIIAVLIAIAAYGIGIVQRSARNTQRRQMLSDIQLLITDIQANYSSYPNLLTLEAPGTVKIGTSTKTDQATYTLTGGFELGSTSNLACGTTTGTTNGTSGVTLESNKVDFGMSSTNRIICVSIESTTGAPLIYSISF